MKLLQLVYKFNECLWLSLATGSLQVSHSDDPWDDREDQVAQDHYLLLLLLRLCNPVSKYRLVLPQQLFQFLVLGFQCLVLGSDLEIVLYLSRCNALVGRAICLLHLKCCLLKSALRETLRRIYEEGTYWTIWASSDSLAYHWDVVSRYLEIARVAKWSL